MSEEASQTLLRRQLLGRGLRCEVVEELGRDLVLAPNAGGRLDLAFVDGLDNLGQSLSVAFTTPLGGDVFNTGFGFNGLNALAEESSPVMVRERLRVAVISLLRKEPRIRRIVDVRFTDEQAPLAERRLDRRVEVQVVFETVAGDQTPLTLANLVPHG